MPPRKRRNSSSQEAEPIPANAPLTPRNMKVVELREALEARGMSPKGLKQALIDRLEKCLEQKTEEENDSVKSKLSNEVSLENNINKTENSNEEEGTLVDIATQLPAPSIENEKSNSVIKVDNFVRPFTIPALKELFASFGTICDFWMDSRRTSCFVQFPTAEIAACCIAKVDGLKWPIDHGKCLRAFPSLLKEMQTARVAEEDGLRPTLREISPVDGADVDSIFRKTVTEPQLYYLPTL